MALISFEAARQTIHDRLRPITDSLTATIDMASGSVLAKDMAAEMANPAFDNSAVDGYLIGTPSAEEGARFDLTGEIRAGSRPPYPSPGSSQAVRIFTGAPVPQGAFCVAMQEDVEADAASIRLKEGVGDAAGIRRAGSDFNAGTTLVEAGKRLGAAEIALAAWNGLAKVEVFRAPRVAVCVTGDELLSPGSIPEEGQIFDSNGPMLEALVRSTGSAEVSRSRLGDDLEATSRHLSDLAERSDLILVSGGASVGDHDHLPAAVVRLGDVFFHGVRIKPGKPVLFGRIGRAFVFALPGNPASSYVTFELFVRTALRRLGGEASPDELWVPARYDGGHGPANRDEFIRVTLEPREDSLWAKPVFEQGSFGLRSLAAAQGLARLCAEVAFKPGDACECLVLK